MGVPPVSPGGSVGYECSFKILLIGDSGVGKSSLLVSFVAAASLDDDIAPTIGTFFTPIVRAQADKPIAASLCLLYVVDYDTRGQLLVSLLLRVTCSINTRQRHSMGAILLRLSHLLPVEGHGRFRPF
jgi:hypothetical protein